MRRNWFDTFYRLDGIGSEDGIEIKIDSDEGLVVKLVVWLERQILITLFALVEKWEGINVIMYHFGN